MRRLRKLTAGGLVAFIVAVALLVTTPNAANAATATMNDYRQTLPASVIDTMTPDERVRWMEGTRAGNVGTGGSITPVRSQPGPRANLIRGGGAGTALLIGGQLVSEMSPATAGEWWRNSECGVFDLNGCKAAERPDHIDEDEWSQCGSGGTDVLGTLNDFAAWWLSAGKDCNEIRQGWGVERTPEYDLGNPVGQTPSAFPLTHTAIPAAPYTNIRPHLRFDFGAVSYVDALASNGHPYAYAYGFNVTDRTPAGNNVTGGIGLYWGELNPSGMTGQVSVNVTRTGLPATYNNVPAEHRPSTCHGYQYCFSPTATRSAQQLAASPWAWQIDRLANISTSGYDPKLFPSNPPVQLGSNPPNLGGALQEVNLVTTITTESGRTYTCRTEGFIESASWVPAPCNPTWAEPDEVITERIVEVVPVRENPTHVPYSNPSREVERTTVPQPVRDQQRENSECSTSTCYVEVMVQRPDGVWVACSKYPELCRDWKRTTETKPTSHPFRCEYNHKVVNLAECRHLARLFEPGAIESGTAYPDPSEEGQPGYHPSNPPGSQTSTTPGPSTAPGTAVRDPEKPRQCFPTGWGVLNPVEWVYRPVMCALEDAFVPRASFVQGLLRDLTNRLDGKAPMILMTAMQGWSFDMPSGCSGINVPFGQLGIPGVSDFRVLNACSDPHVSNLANWSKIAVTVIFAVGSTFATVRNIGAIFAYNTGNSA